jgi:hypothetical protein
MAHTPHWQQITDSLNSYASSIIGSAYDTISSFLIAGLWEVIGRAVADFGNELLQAGAIYIFQGVNPTATTGAYAPFGNWNSDGVDGLSTANITPVKAAGLVRTADPGLYVVLAPVSFSGATAGNVIFDFEIHHFDASAPALIPTGYAFKRKLGPAGDVGAAIAVALVRLDEDDEVEVLVLNYTGSKTIIIEMAALILIRIGA